MKQLAKHIVATAMLGSALVSTSVMAEQKIGVVDVQGVFQAMPQAAEISNNIQLEFKDQIDEVNQLQKDGQFFAERLQRDAATMSEQEKKDLQDKILAVREKLAEKGQPLQQNIQRRSNEERNKLLGLIKQAIDAVAAKEGYDLILNAGAVSFAKDEHDLSEKVLSQVSSIN
ncbi:OmpH family outer membrane protein [Alteromonas aestuariivivens]|uniref:OmpH family outer membrane protein n=1 Tax=Alteromonas aestuariivivens TaxID=1938339 RepID=A0A3D8M3U0_9ALTE|nr:OmpH family outer membrane protein [Alteromonas aestuariivivens]RDV24407.1 OmpH family outer membrane protein [Alteromonas aestuariivivens]